MNPYQWIGLDPQTKNPNHFQLLGVKSQFTDETEFLRLVKESVAAKLARLDRPELAAHAETVEKLKQRILIAGKILADSAKRTQYLEQLKSSSAKSNSSPAKSDSSSAPKPKTRSKSVESDKSRSPQSPQSAKSAKSAKSPKVADSHSVTKKSGTSPSATSKSLTPSTTTQVAAASQTPSASDEELPLAIPLRKSGAGQLTRGPVEQIPNPASPKSSALLSELSDDVGAMNVGAMDIGAMDIGLKIKSKRIPRRKTGPGLILAGTVMVLAAMAGLALITYFLSRPIGDAGLAKSETPIDQAVRNSTESLETSLSPTVDTWKLTDSEKEPAPENDRGVDPFEDNDDSKREVSEKSEPASTPPSTREGPSENPANSLRAEKGLPAEQAEDESKQPAILPELEQYYFQRALRRIQAALHRQDTVLASELGSDLTSSMIDRMGAIESEYDPMINDVGLAQAYDDVGSFVERFWDQFELSAGNISSGQELIANGNPFSFVEYENGQLIVRGPGYNLRYLREHIPTELAVAIAEQGAIEDIPTWRFHLAAFLATRWGGHRLYRDRIQQLVEQSKQDGHDDTSLRIYLDDMADSNCIRVNVQIPQPQLATDFQEAVAKNWMAQHDNFAQWSPHERFSQWLQWKGTAAGKTGQELEPETHFEPHFERLRMAVEKAIEIAIEAQEAWWLAEAVSELSYLTDLDADQLLLKYLSTMASQKLEIRQAIELRQVADLLLERTNRKPALGAEARRLQQQVQALERQFNLKGTAQAFGALR